MRPSEFTELERLARHWERIADFLDEDAKRFRGKLEVQIRQRAETYRACAQELAAVTGAFDIEGGGDYGE